MKEAECYRLYQRFASREVDEISDLVVSSCRGIPTILDIGAGNGMLLKTKHPQTLLRL